ncbi:hypothetical protein [Cysteiniphilum litorale]|uniref:hypothetical protein n=1 Tax=Cysteiniphilum litorale TaxID=2056700 RepID=UPI003F885556
MVDAKTHTINSLDNIKDHDIDAIFADSLMQKKLTDQISSLIQLDGVMSFDFIRITNNHTFYYLGTKPKQDLKDYLISGLWQFDGLFNLNQTRAYHIVDYNEIISANLSALPTKSIQPFLHQITLGIEQIYANHKDILLFGTSNTAFKGFSLAKKALYFQRLRAVMSLIYKTVRFRHMIQLHQHDIDTLMSLANPIIHDFNYQDTMMSSFNLTENELIYLKMLASGCSAKEVANHLDKSYRYIQNVIRRLIQRFDVLDKNQLEDISQIITSYDY